MGLMESVRIDTANAPQGASANSTSICWSSSKLRCSPLMLASMAWLWDLESINVLSLSELAVQSRGEMEDHLSTIVEEVCFEADLR